MQRSFISMLVLVSATGLALLALRDTALMGPDPAGPLGRLIGNRLASFAVTNPVACEMRSLNSPSELWLLSNKLGPDVPVRSRHGDLLARSTLPKRPCRRGPRSPDSTGQGYT